jgi:hypothetical protein
MGGLAFQEIRRLGHSVLPDRHGAGDPDRSRNAGRGPTVFINGLNVHWSTIGFGAQLTWTLPFGLLIMFAVFNRFDKEASGKRPI